MFVLQAFERPWRVALASRGLPEDTANDAVIASTSNVLDPDRDDPELGADRKRNLKLSHLKCARWRWPFRSTSTCWATPAAAPRLRLSLANAGRDTRALQP